MEPPQLRLIHSDPRKTNGRDLAFETLARETGTDWNVGRGELNKALATIKAYDDVSPERLPEEIRVRCGLYRSTMSSALLTPTALAKHWKRVREITRPAPTVRQHCERCDDLRLVVAETRDDGTETYKQCPDCTP